MQMKITTFSVGIKGVRPLIMHNGRLANPMDSHTKALKAASSKYKTSKSDDDFEEVSRTEFFGALYFDPKLGPVVPVDNLQAMLVEGTRKRKLGKQIEALVQVMDPEQGTGYRLRYDGPRDRDGLFADEQFRFIKGVKVGQSTVMRTRPRFPQWEVDFILEVTEGGPNADQIRDALDDAGLLVGLCDWTPRYGRFEVTKFEQS
jgi:hypothetical protein